MAGRRARSLKCGFLILMLLTIGRGQATDVDVFNQVPSSSRPQLIRRLEKYVQYERERRYAELYGLLSDPHIAYLEKLGIKGKSAYVKHRQAASVIINFEPLSVSTRDSSWGKVYHIEGIVKSRWGNRIDDEKGSLQAILQGGKWYFTEVGVEISEDQH